MTVNLTVRGFGLPNLCRKAGACGLRYDVTTPRPLVVSLCRNIISYLLGGQSR